MKIFGIQNIVRQNYFQNNANSKYKNTLQNISQNKPSALYTDYFLSFGTRGTIYTKTDPALKSIETVKSRGGVVPERVEKLAKEYAKDETLSKLTLAEVHKDAYQDLKKCKTLDEAKELFPEFANALPADEPSAQEGSVLYGIQQGDIEIAPCGIETDDASLKLLQYIWAELYSPARTSRFVRYTNKYYAIHELSHTISKLKIPLFDYEYAQAAKFEKGHHRNG